MPNVFRPASLLIETDLERDAVNEQMIMHPGANNPAASRIIVHETLHYWQLLTQTCMLELATEDLARLEQYERDGTLAGPGPRRREYMRRHEDVGFSALDLQEALTRYWEIHILGPQELLRLERADPQRQWPAEAETLYAELEKSDRLTGPGGSGYTLHCYNLAMVVAAGAYARPYLLLAARLEPLAAAGAFPLLAFIALHTPQPVLFYARLVEIVAPLFDGYGPTEKIEDFWKEAFVPATAAALHLAKALDVPVHFAPMLAELDGAIGRSKPHQWARHMLDLAMHVLAACEPIREQADRNGRPPLEEAALELTFYFATPGVHRDFLCAWVPPPIVRFADGKRELPGEIHRRRDGPADNEREQCLSAQFVTVADESAALDARWRTFVRAGLRQGFSTGAPMPSACGSAVYDGVRAIARLVMKRDQILLVWLMQLLDPEVERPHPLGGRGGWERFYRSALVGQTIYATHIDNVCAMLLVQLASGQSLRHHDAETGILWEWPASPFGAALAAEYCAVAAERALHDFERAALCRTIQLEALKSELVSNVMRLNEPRRLISALAERIELLEMAARLAGSDVHVRERMRQYALAPERARPFPAASPSPQDGFFRRLFRRGSGPRRTAGLRS